MSRIKGKFYEDVAVNYLKNKGYKILQRNFTFGKGEIDIIAKKRAEIVFVEVRGRKKEDLVPPAETITPYKMKNIIKTAKGYLLKEKDRAIKKIEGLRFDVICITGDKKEKFKIDHIKSAFDLNQAGLGRGNMF